MAGIEDDTRETARAFIAQCLETAGLSPYAMARKAGLSHTTITRLLNKADTKVVPKLATLAKIGAVAGLTPPSLGSLSLAHVLSPHWAPVVGELRYGTWTEGGSVEDGGIPVHMARYEHVRLFAFRNQPLPKDTKYAGASALIAADRAEVGLRIGDDVIVRRTRGQLVETTVRQVAQNGQGEIALLPHSTDTSVGPVTFPRHDGDDDIEILGIVVGSIAEGRYGQGPDLTV